MSSDETFDEFRLRREIEMMEQEFRKRATVQRERVQELLEGDEQTAEIHEKVHAEMQDFLKDSTEAAERVLENYSRDKERAGKVQEELRSKLEDFMSGMNGDRQEPVPEQTGRPAPPPAAGAPPPPVAESPPEGDGSSPRPRDLASALQRLRGGGAAPAPMPKPQEPPPAAPPPPDRSPVRGRNDILASVENTLDQMGDFLLRKVEEGGDPADEPVAPGLGALARDTLEPPPEDLNLEKVRVAAGEFPPISDESHEVKLNDPSGLTPPSAAGPAAGGATNAFQADPEEDRDIDHELEVQDPEGWDLPTGPEAPGAWVVARQKEEGEAGLSGIAGDSYLMKKLSQEVRQMNRLYRLLLDKGVVTREEVEGPGAARPSSDDDDVVSIDDMDEDRYRPIMTSEKDFSLSGLVADVHRLKTLREVLIKKKIVTEKELKKAEG